MEMDVGAWRGVVKLMKDGRVSRWKVNAVWWSIELDQADAFLDVSASLAFRDLQALPPNGLTLRSILTPHFGEDSFRKSNRPLPRQFHGDQSQASCKMGADEDERLQAEIDLLLAMYPDNVTYDPKSREMKYASDDGSFTLRLPSGYLMDELPVTLSAAIGKSDAREQVKQLIRSQNAAEEVLDSLIAAFNDLAASQQSEAEPTSEPPASSEANANSSGSENATIIIWLHHLLNTNKRKMALSPQQGVSGVTKPGYPGVLIYSGPSSLVRDHVAELRQQNWQAFQVRLESDKAWAFAHGKGVREVEAMKDVVAAVGEERKEAFMEAMRMK